MYKSIIKSNLVYLVATSFLFSPHVVGTVFAQAPGDDFPDIVPDVVSPAAPGTDLLLLSPLPESKFPLVDPSNLSENTYTRKPSVPSLPTLPQPSQVFSGGLDLVPAPALANPSPVPALPPLPQPSQVFSGGLDLVPAPAAGGFQISIDPLPNLTNHVNFLISLGLPDLASSPSIMGKACSLLGVSLANCASNSTSYTEAEKTELVGALMMVIADIGAQDPSTWDEHERALISWVEDRIQAQQIDYAERQIEAWEEFKADYEQSVLNGPKFSILLDTGPDPSNFVSPALYDWSESQENSVRQLTQGFVNSPVLVGLVSGVGIGAGLGAGIGIGIGVATATMAGYGATAAAGAFLTSVGAGVGATAATVAAGIAAPAAIAVIAVAIVAMAGTKINNANEMEALIYASLEEVTNTRPNFHDIVTADGAEEGIALALMDAFYGNP